ncbi:LOW QUALITY PROTEIN: hypothetical protein YC2023_079621 [Brassica napus]
METNRDMKLTRGSQLGIPMTEETRTVLTTTHKVRSSPIRRASPDSQRTISAAYVTNRFGYGSRGQSHRSPQKLAQEWRPVRQSINEGKKNDENQTVLGETEEDRRKRLKGKMIAQDPPAAPPRPIPDRGTLTIREPSSNMQQQMQGGCEKEKQTPTKNREEENKQSSERLGSANTPTNIEGGLDDPDSLDNVPEDDGVLDDETFEKMMELYTEPEAFVDDEEMQNVDEVDDLMEEEQEMERARVEKEKRAETEKGKSKGLMVKKIKDFGMADYCLLPMSNGSKTILNSVENKTNERAGIPLVINT